jgi:hypothetical protein
MPKGIKTDTRDDQPDPANIDAEELSTNEQANILPIFAGESKFATIWLCLPFNEYSKDAGESSPKKG